VIAIFAEMGPMTQITKAEKEPRNAIDELNSGTRIDTPTASNVNETLSMAINIYWRACLDSVGGPSLRVEIVFCSREDCGSVSSPSLVSRTTLI
jgi:hypothetical protein